MERAHVYTYQVVEVESQGDTVTAVVVAVYVRNVEDGDDAPVLPEDDGEGDALENAEADDEMGNDEILDDDEKEEDDIPANDDDSLKDAEVVADHSGPVPEYVPVVQDADDWTPFLYRRVTQLGKLTAFYH